MRDGTGAVVAEAKVSAEDSSTQLKQTVFTGIDGRYLFAVLPAATYSVAVAKDGFAASRQDGIVLDAASNRTADFVLELSAIESTVAVTAVAEQVQTESGDVSRVVNSRQVEQTALNGRNSLQLLRLLAGTVAVTLDPFSLGSSTLGQAINGIRSASIYTTIDGVANISDGGNDLLAVNPNIDTLSEVQVLTASYAAEFGSRMGAMVNEVTKSGTHEVHGSAFEFVRNDYFDARSFFSAGREPLHFNDFGWTLGGPVTVPRHFNSDRNKLFFFAAEEWKYNHQAQTNLNVVPTAAERAGDFLGTGLPAPVDPSNHQPFPGAVVPVSRWSQNGPRLLSPIPAPNYSSAGGNYSITEVATTDSREDLLRLDYDPSSNTQVSFNVRHIQQSGYSPFVGTTLGLGPVADQQPGYVSSIQMTHSFSSTLVNFASFGVTHELLLDHANPVTLLKSVTGVDFPEIYPSNSFGTGPALNVAGFTPYRQGNPRTHQGDGILQARDDLTKVAGNHILKFGGQVVRSRRNAYDSGLNTYGSVTFGTGAPNSTGNALADVLLGNFLTYIEADTGDFWYSRFNQFETYAEDTWRLNRRLTLNLGLRYSIIPPNTSAAGNISSFVPSLYVPSQAPTVNPSDGSIVPGTGNPYNGLSLWGNSWPAAAYGRVSQVNNPAITALFGHLPAGGTATQWRNFGPRFGFAYDPRGDEKMAVRGGFGIFYDRTYQDIQGVPSGTSNVPFQYIANVSGGNIDNPGSGARAFPPNPSTRVGGVPRTMSYNLDVERLLPGEILLDVGSVGTLGRHLLQSDDLNALPVGTRLTAPNSTININALRRYAGYASILSSNYVDNSNYNSLQVSARRRLVRSLAFGLSYTWSKTLDTSNGTPLDPYNVRPDYGPSAIDRRQVLAVNYQYELPFLKDHRPGVLRTALGGWTISGVTSYQSGAPNDLTLNGDIARDGQTFTRATLLGNPNLPSDQRTLARWFNTSLALTASQMTPGRNGTSGRGIVTGPAYSQWDVSVLKNFAAGEHRYLQLRMEAFNVLNHPWFTSLGTTVGTPTFGAVTAAGPGRVMALGMKLVL
ncbi:MAG TPA: carboxypeptidase regulatory-like domain-containing protein [Bryobacteraceae bacterium]|nr:carboxypeptidase regulatory-like domain-containing protein [Bryobacteraceae bacterium]